MTGVYQGYVAAINSRLALGTRLTEVLETWNTFDWVVAYVHIAVLRALIWSSWSTKYNKLGRFLFKKRLFSVSQEYRVYCILYLSRLGLKFSPCIMVLRKCMYFYFVRIWKECLNYFQLEAIQTTKHRSFSLDSS